MMDEHVRTAMNLLPSITLAFVGIGSLNSYSIAIRDETILTQADLDEVISSGAVGDIALRFIDAKGQPVFSELSDRIIGIDIEHLRQIPRVVGVAGGRNKIEPIRAALHGRLLNVLITDQSTAKALLEA
jgi:DNA-binding transcriptional regulator LsrR (DeoR family)